MGHTELIPHLFRSEFQRIVAVLCRHYGIGFLDEAEDIASSTFLAALETWPYEGVPPSPVGWLHTVARNKAINGWKRRDLFRRKIRPELSKHYHDPEQEIQIDLSEDTIRDSQLRMIFSVCDPALSPEVQVALALRILCGFSVVEIASAFLATPEAIEKRIQRGKERLRSGKGLAEVVGPSLILERSPAVMATLYLLFNEGYHATSGVTPVRKELCLEAMRMTMMLLEGPWSIVAEAKALFALMCFQASRLGARIMPFAVPISLDEQDPALWDHALITQGAWWMKESAEGNELSRYHLEAMIAWKHVQGVPAKDKWKDILVLYDRLLAFGSNPVLELNRLYVLAKVSGREVALAASSSIDPRDDPYRHSLLAWLKEESDPGKSRIHLEQAIASARNPMDRMLLCRRLDHLGGHDR